MKKVDFNVRNDWEYVNNYKELQQAFNRVKVDKVFNVNQLSKGKRQDSIEFMQWFKGYWDSVMGGEEVEYDGVGRRQMCKTGDWKKFSVGADGKAVGVKATGGSGRATGGTGQRARGQQQQRVETVGRKNMMGQTAGMMGRSKGGVTGGGQDGGATIKAVRSVETPSAVVYKNDPETEEKIQQLMEEVTELKLKVDTAERERDFYFDKLRDVEILCQAPELAHVPVLRVVEKVLYAIDSDEAKQVMAEAQEELGAQLLAPEEVEDDHTNVGQETDAPVHACDPTASATDTYKDGVHEESITGHGTMASSAPVLASS